MILNLNNIKAVIFDMDGTMIDNMGYHKNAWQSFCKRYGIEMLDDEFKNKLSGKKNDDYFKILFGKDFSKKELVDMAEEKELIYREMCEPNVVEITGLTKLLQKLKEKNIVCAVATTSPLANREMVFGKLPLLSFFTLVVGDEDVVKGKPDPEIYLKTIRELGLKPEQCIVFEDSPAGVNSARNAGVAEIVGILSSHSKEELKEADFFIHDYSEIEI